MTKKKIISRFMAALMAAFILCFSIVPVSAASVSDLVLPDSGLWQYNYGDDLAINIIDQFYSNPSVANLGYTKDNSYLSVSYNTANSWYIFCCIKFDNAVYGDFTCGDGDGVFITSSSLISATLRATKDNISSYAFSQSSNNIHSTSNNIPGIAYFFNNQIYSFFTCSYKSNGYNSFQSLSSYSKFLFSYVKYIGPVKPDDITSDSHVYYGFPVGGINKKAFASWLVDEGKESVINSAGYSFTSKQIESLVDVWATYGYHPLSFLSSLTKTFNIVTELKGAIALTQTINQLYRDYQEYLNTYELSKLDDPVNLPHWRTDKEDTSLITDIEEDSTDTSLLRAILRAVVHLPSDIAVHFNYVKTGFNDILFDFQNQINVMADLPDNIGVAVANNINPTLNSIDTNVNAMAVGVADIDANVNAMAVGVADIDANLGDVNLSLEKIDDSVNTVNNSVNSVNGSVNNLDVSLHEINNTLNDGSGSCSGDCSGSRPCAPDLPEAEFDDLYEQSGDFFKFFRDLLDSSGWIPASLFTAACLVAIFMRVWGR